MVLAKAKGMQHVWCEMSQALCGHWVRHRVLALFPEVCLTVHTAGRRSSVTSPNKCWFVRRLHDRQGLRPHRRVCSSSTQVLNRRPCYAFSHVHSKTSAHRQRPEHADTDTPSAGRAALGGQPDSRPSGWRCMQKAMP